ncbi:TIGD6 [Cordylochernes scorpioides]|uniref:TIGD6 n=1 Tax=Cordylochernes scorpioides TaxID=51811 RepID=A0ABY6LI31_9ARAC|nr:TIGD6 [Cordylochernes scorpioides]
MTSSCTLLRNKRPAAGPFMKITCSTLKRDRDGEFPEIEEALFRWIRQANAMKLAINGNILKEKAILLALKMGQDNFEASNGWLEKFKARRNIAFKQLHGEAGSVDANSVATWKGFVMDEAMEEVVEEEMNRCFEALKKHQAIDVNNIDFLEVDKDVQVAGEQSNEEIVKEVMGKEEDEEVEPTEKDLNKTSITPAAAVDAFNTINTLCYLKDISEEERHACLLKIDYPEYILNRISEKKQTSIKYIFF